MLRSFSFFLFCLITWVATASNYYWVGGSGNWSEYNSHWATSSGGSSFHNQVPTNSDNVFFDANSGFTVASKTVTVDQTIVYCNDMDWTGAANTPIFQTNLNTNVIKIFGSLRLIAAMNYQINGPVSFEGGSIGKTIFSGRKTLTEVTFNGLGGEWSLLDSLKVSQVLTLQAGTLKANDQVIKVPMFHCSNTNVRSLVLGNTDFITSSWNTAIYTNFTFDAGTSTVKFVYTTSAYGLKTYGANLNFYNVLVDASVIQFKIEGNDNYHKLTLNANTEVKSFPARYDSLVLGAGKTFLFSGTHQIRSGGRLVSQATCQHPIALYGSNNCVFDISQSGISSYLFNNLYISNISLTKGSVSVSSSNSYDIENAIGWNITTSSARNLYWVGGGGNWNDVANWSTTSGGVGGACIPSPVDNVFFDANSGFTSINKTVNFGLDGIYCKDITWTGVLNTPLFHGSNMRVFGSLTFVSGMNIYIPYAYFQSSLTGNTITMAGQTFFANVNFNGIGEWVLQDHFRANGVLYLNGGTLRTNNQPVTVGSLHSNSSQPCSLYLGSSTIELKGWDQNIWYTPQNSLSLYVGTSTIKLFSSNNTASVVTGNATTGLTFYNFVVDAPFPINFGEGVNNFHKLHLKSEVTIYRSHTCDSIVLEPDQVYLFNGGVLTINPGGDFVAKGTCDRMITIVGTTYSYLSKASGTITMDYVIMNDFKTMGGATFTATNSIDKGGNTGWSMPTPVSRNLYWVGGQGDWFDALHWATSNGGSGGNCPPLMTDNVFFNGNSGFTSGSKTVTLSGRKAYCKSMDWTGATSNPIFMQNETLTINGSVTLNANMTYNANGYPVLFESGQAGNTIRSYGKKFHYVVFNNPKGEWVLLDSLAINDRIKIADGSFNTNGNPISATLMSVVDIYSDSVTVRLGSSRIWLKDAFVTEGDTTGKLDFDAGTSEIIVTLNNAINSGAIHMSVYDQGLKFYKFTFKEGIGTSYISGIHHFYKLTLGTSAHIENFNVLNYLELKHGKTYTVTANKIIYFSNDGTLIATGLPGFPIEIISTIDGQQISFYKETGTVCGEYLFLKNVNATGGATWYAGINGADIGNNTGWLFEPCPFSEVNYSNETTLLSLAPNPVSGPAIVTFHSNETGVAELSLKEITGKEVQHKKCLLNTGKNEIDMNFSGINKGIYYLEIVSSGKRELIKVVME